VPTKHPDQLVRGAVGLSFHNTSEIKIKTNQCVRFTYIYDSITIQFSLCFTYTIQLLYNSVTLAACCWTPVSNGVMPIDCIRSYKLLVYVFIFLPIAILKSQKFCSTLLVGLSLTNMVNAIFIFLCFWLRLCFSLFQ